MRDYQRKRNNRYKLPADLWYRTLYFIRGYERMRAEYDERIDEGMSIGSDSAPVGKTNRTGDPTAAKAMKLSDLSEQVRAIERARLAIPYEYVEGIWNNIMNHDPYPRDADPRTYGTWKARFVYEVAKNMRWI